MLFEEKDIVNKEFYEGVKNMINCSICFNIVKDPVQCKGCQHCFCSQCLLNLKSCPYGCKSFKFVPSLLGKQLLSELIIKCECGEKVGYDYLNKHVEECMKTGYRIKYFELKKKYDLLSKEINMEDKENFNDYTIKSSLHRHPISCIRSFLQTWKCDNCNNCYNDDIPAYNCTLCDFDLCYECAKNTITKGTLKKEMYSYYKNQPKALAQYATLSRLHRHPIEYLRSFGQEWFCDNCQNKFNHDIPSFRCTLCDFDLCYDCALKTSTQQNFNIQQITNVQQNFNVQQNQNPNIQQNQNPNIQHNYNIQQNYNVQQNFNIQPNLNVQPNLMVKPGLNVRQNSNIQQNLMVKPGLNVRQNSNVH